MLGINPSIMVHEIKTYPLVKPVRQKIRQVHPRKATTIKAEIEKLLKAGFIYPVPLTEWVSNIVPVNKKKGTIKVCIDFRDLNKSCPKDNFPTLHIDQIINNYAEVPSYHSWMASPTTIRLRYFPPISIRRNSFSHGEPSHIRSLTIWLEKCWSHIPACNVLCVSRY